MHGAVSKRRTKHGGIFKPLFVAPPTHESTGWRKFCSVRRGSCHLKKVEPRKDNCFIIFVHHRLSPNPDCELLWASVSHRVVLLLSSGPPGSVSVMDKGRGTKGHAKRLDGKARLC